MLSPPKQQDVNVAQMTLPVTRARPKEKLVIKQIKYGVFESKKCDFCGLLPTKHYCKVPLPGSMISSEGSEFREIFGKVLCMNYRSEWGMQTTLQINVSSSVSTSLNKT